MARLFQDVFVRSVQEEAPTLRPILLLLVSILVLPSVAVPSPAAATHCVSGPPGCVAWSATTPGAAANGTALAPRGNILYVPTSTPNGWAMTAFETTTGARIWTWGLTFTPVVAIVDRDETTLYVAGESMAQGAHIAALDALTGAPRWARTYSSVAYIDRLVAGDESLLALGHDAGSRVLRIAKLDGRAQLAVASDLGASSMAVVGDLVVLGGATWTFQGGSRPVVEAWRLGGSLLWSHQLAGGEAARVVAARGASANRILAASASEVLSFTLEGSIVADAPLPGGELKGLVASADGSRTVVLSRTDGANGGDAKITLLDASQPEGLIRWHVTHDAAYDVPVDAALAYDGSSLWVNLYEQTIGSTIEPRLIAYDGASGATRWSYAPPGVTIRPAERVFASPQGERIFAIDVDPWASTFITAFRGP